MCPWLGKVFGRIFPKELSCHCMLIETNEGLILFDTGLGVEDIKNLGG